jgi:hypothetical protein
MLKVKGRRRAARIRGDRFGLITAISKNSKPDKPGAFLDGFVGAFTQIDEKSDWINLNTGKRAETDELAEVRIPSDLRPNAAFHRFRFYLKEHKLIFEIGNSGAKLTPRNAGVLFERLFSAQKLIDEFGEVAVTVLPTSDSVSEIMNDPGLRAIHLVIYAPNPDTGRDAEREFRDRLEHMRVRRLEQLVVAKAKASIQPDSELIESATVASTNGRVDATVVREGRSIKLSTTETPFVYTHTYTASDNSIDAMEFAIAADRVWRRIRSK